MSDDPVADFISAEVARTVELVAQRGRTRLLAPTGELGTVPEEKLAEALEAGAKVMSPEAMRELRQTTFMAHTLLQEKQRPAKKRKRRSIVTGGRR